MPDDDLPPQLPPGTAPATPPVESSFAGSIDPLPALGIKPPPDELLPAPRGMEGTGPPRSNSPWEIDCVGCGKVEDGSESDGNTIQCSDCKHWSHVECMSTQFDFKLPEGPDELEHMSWFCPRCMKLSVWDDNLYVIELDS